MVGAGEVEGTEEVGGEGTGEVEAKGLVYQEALAGRSMDDL